MTILCHQLFLTQKKLKEMNYKMNKSSESAVKASYEISCLLAKHTKPFSEGSMVKECMIKAAENVCPEKVKVFQEISLSRNTVAQRITQIVDDLREQLQELSSSFQCFSIALDESNDIVDVAQIALFLRACDDSLKVTEEFLELIPIHGTTTGEDICDAVWEILQKYKLPLQRLVAVTTDGAPAMIGRDKGFAATIGKKLKNECPEKPKLQTFHCIIHQQCLCYRVLKNCELHSIQRAYHRQFAQLLQDVDSEFEGLPYYTEARSYFLKNGTN